ncbi:PREDICTED: uncharacterized protein LOC104809550 [Tarenaya hassleriana]|uniref:uncharacterized protein LOC104809550 n=1 Tax=Tarenaya hassleriana TaxID=28532 RepID=UPI00053C1D18|nr:PREDICTED: uncharacterized protein LOC104809550 [Tarenaya hassleriana]
MVSFGSWIMSIKAVLISTGVIAMALLLKVYVPVAIDFSVSRASILWSSLLLWLKPPYLYFVTNGIIITIAASSKFYRSSSYRDDDQDVDVVSGSGSIQTGQIFHQSPPRQLVVMAVDSATDFGLETDSLPLTVEDVEEELSTAGTAVVYAEEDELPDMPEESSAAAAEEEEKRVVVESYDLIADDGDEFVAPMQTPALKWMESPEIGSENLPLTERLLLSARLGHRETVKSSPEGGARALRKGAKPMRHETLENTWKMIKEKKSMPLTRQYMKCVTWQNQGRVISNAAEFKKSETFRDRTNYYQSSPEDTTMPMIVRKEPSLSQDELNRRVEAFIKKFNEDMRLQRLESLKKCKEMVSRLSRGT